MCAWWEVEMGRLGEDFRLLPAEREAENEAGGGWHYYGGRQDGNGGRRSQRPISRLSSCPGPPLPPHISQASKCFSIAVNQFRGIINTSDPMSSQICASSSSIQSLNWKVETKTSCFAKHITITDKNTNADQKSAKPKWDEEPVEEQRRDRVPVFFAKRRKGNPANNPTHPWLQSDNTHNGNEFSYFKITLQPTF